MNRLKRAYENVKLPYPAITAFWNTLSQHARRTGHHCSPLLLYMPARPSSFFHDTSVPAAPCLKNLNGDSEVDLSSCSRTADTRSARKRNKNSPRAHMHARGRCVSPVYMNRVRWNMRTGQGDDFETIDARGTFAMLYVFALSIQRAEKLTSLELLAWLLQPGSSLGTCGSTHSSAVIPVGLCKHLCHLSLRHVAVGESFRQHLIGAFHATESDATTTTVFRVRCSIANMQCGDTATHQNLPNPEEPTPHTLEGGERATNAAKSMDIVK